MPTFLTGEQKPIRCQHKEDLAYVYTMGH